MKHRLRDRSQKQEKKQIPQNDPYKLSIHTSSNFNKSDSGSKRLNISRMLENSRKKISMRKASELFQSGGIRPQSTKNLKRNQVIQFDNIKWISIISAYDPSRLKNVSVSKKSCQKFLSSNQQNIKSDSRNLLYFNDLIKNFKSWHNKIQMQYCYIMNKFLRQRQSANITLVQLRPKLDQVISETLRMQQNLQDCLKSYQNHEFRQLVEKYYISLVQCQKIEKIIQSVDKSKNKIVNLYKKFDDDRKIEQKITRVKNQGISKVKQIASDYQVQIQSKIMDRIQDAINQIAQKSGQAYRKIKGVKHLIEKFKNTQHQSQEMNKIDIEAINFMGKVCKQICYEAQAFEQFSSRFMVDGGIINQDLQKIIKKYQQQVLNQRKKAIELQMKFLNIIFCETIKKLKENSKISAVYENADAHNEEYKKILRMIQDIADCIRDQDKRVSLQRLIKQTRTVLDRLYEDLKFLKQNKKFQEIDTEEGLISILEVSKLIKEYKDKILLVRKKFQSAHRQVQLSPIKVQPIGNDNETQFIALVITLSKKINNSGLKGKLQKEACFGSINQNLGLIQMAKQIDKENVLAQITSISNQFLELQSKNVFEKYFGPLKLQNLIFKESIVMVELKNIALITKQKNIIPQLTQLLSERNQWIQKHKKISPQMKRYFERILALTLVKGLKTEDIKQIEDPQGMTFPTKQNQIQGLKSKAKYRQVLFDLIQGSVIQTTKSLISQNAEQKSQQKTKNHRVLKSAKTKYNFYISDVLEKNITTINNFVKSFIKISEIKKNVSSESYLAKEYFFEFCQRLFTEVFLKQQEKAQIISQNLMIKNLLKQLIQISYDRFLSLTRKIIEEENQWKDNEKKTKSQSQLNLNKIPIYLQKVLDIFQFYKTKTQNLYEVTKQALQSLDKPVENVENSHEQIDEYLKLTVYAKVINALVKYCKDTDQKVHVILDSKKSPIALIDYQENVLKQVFPGLKKGKQLTVNQISKLLLREAKIGIQLKTKKDKNQTLTKEKSKSKKKQSDMEEQILDEDQSDIKDDMEEQYLADEEIEQIQDNNDDIPQDDEGMTEQLGEEVQQQEPEEDMVQDFEAPQDQIEQEKVQQEQALQDLIEESQNLSKSKGKSNHNNKKIKTNNEIDQFEEYEWEQENPKAKKQVKNKIEDAKLKEKQLKQKQEKQKIKKLEEQKKLKEEKQEVQRMKKQHIVFSQTQPPKKILQNSVYEILSFITSLYQLKKLITYVSSFEENYFKNFIDWAKVQHYYNDHNLVSEDNDKKQIEKYVKNLEDDVQNRLKTQFKSEPNVFNEIRNLEFIKKIKKHLLLLKNGNWEALQSILSQNHVSYNVLKSSNSVLYIWIKQSNQDFDQVRSIHGYLTKSMKVYQRNLFDLKGFTEKCCTVRLNESKQHSFVSVSYEFKAETSFVGKFSEIEQNYQKLMQLINDFSNGAKDIVNKFDFCLQLYKKALQIKQKVNLDLNWYADKIKFLQKYGTDELYPLTYMNFIKQNIKAVIKKVKSLESKLYNLSFKCERSNLFQCLQEICQLYGQEIEKKVSLSKGQSKFITLLFDKTTLKENEEKIKRILVSKPNDSQEEAQKILLSLVYGQQIQQLGQITDYQILKNAQKIDLKSSEMILEIIATLRIDHSYILIKNKNFQFFSIKKQKQQCISNFFQKIANSIMENKQISGISSGTQFLESLKQLSNSKNSQIYQKVLSKQNLEKLFKQEIKNQKLYTQTKITVNDQLLMFGQLWLEQSVKLIKEIVQCSNGNKNQINKILGNLKKLRPCHFIYHKRFSNDKQSQVLGLWTQHLSNLQKILQNTKNTISKKSWILLLNSVSQNFNDKFPNELKNNIQTIKSLLQLSNISSSLEEISKQVKTIFEWLVQKDKQQGKIQFSVITLKKQREIIFFDCNISGFSEDYFNQNFSFIQFLNLQLKEFLSNQLISNMSFEKHDEIRTDLKLKKNDKIYEIQVEKLSSSVLQFITSILGQQNQKKRNKITRDIVKVFNKIYYLSRTTESLNFKQQSQLLQSLRKDFKKQLGSLKLIYTFKAFLSFFNKTLWKNSKTTQNILQVLDKNLKQNQKIPEQQIQEILTKLQKIKVNNKTSSIDSYKPFYSWFYQTVMSIMKLPFYNIITHVSVNQKSKQTETSFLGVIVTQKPTKSGQQNEELQKLIKEIFLYAQHKPIYLKQNDLTVELLKQPAYVSLQATINGIQLNEIVEYLNENCQQDDKDSQKILYLRVDEIHKSNDNQERELLKIIPLIDFVQQTQQQFNIHVTEQNLTVEIEFNVIYAQKNISNTQKDVTKSCIPMNGSSVDSFQKVYIGKKLKLQKIKSWLYGFYLKRKNQIQVENKDKTIEEFFNGFVQYFMITVANQSREAVKKIIKKIELKSVLEYKNRSAKDEKLYLETSLKLLEACKKELQKFKAKEYEKKLSLQKHYDKDIVELIQNFDYKLYDQLKNAESQIKSKMEKKISSLAHDKVKEIYIAFKQRKEQQEKIIASKKQEEQQKQKNQQNTNLQKQAQLLDTNGQPQKVKSVQKLEQETVKVQNKILERLKEISSLKETNFEQYLMKKIELLFDGLNQQKILQIENQINEKFNEKISQITQKQNQNFYEKLKKKVYQYLKNKEKLDEIDLIPHQRLLFLYFILEKNETCYVQLFISQK